MMSVIARATTVPVARVTRGPVVPRTTALEVRHTAAQVVLAAVYLVARSMRVQAALLTVGQVAPDTTDSEARRMTVLVALHTRGQVVLATLAQGGPATLVRAEMGNVVQQSVDELLAATHAVGQPVVGTMWPCRSG
jgi:hypothetical protein